MKGLRSFIAILGLSLMMLIATFAWVLSASAQTSGEANQIVIRSQDTRSGQIVVDSVTAAQAGWLVVYTNTSFTGLVIGWVPVHKGLNTNLKMNVDSGLADPYPTLWAVLHVDRGVIGLMELPVIDGPAQQNGQTVMVAFGTTAPSAATATPQGPAVNQIAIRSQDTRSGQITVDSVTAAQAGWLVVYTDTSLSLGSMVGWVPIHQGLNTNLKVDINSGLAEPLATLWAVLHVDRGVIGLMELPMIDGPVQQNGQTVMVAFGTHAQGAATAVPQVSAASATGGAPKLLPSAGGNERPWGGWLVSVGLGSLLLVAGMVLPRMMARAQSPSDQEK